MHTEQNLPNQNYWSEQSTPWSVVPLAMFLYLIYAVFLTPKHVAKSEKFITAESNPILGFAFPRKIECDVRPPYKNSTDYNGHKPYLAFLPGY